VAADPDVARSRAHRDDLDPLRGRLAAHDDLGAADVDSNLKTRPGRQRERAAGEGKRESWVSFMEDGFFLGCSIRRVRRRFREKLRPRAARGSPGPKGIRFWRGDCFQFVSSNKCCLILGNDEGHRARPRPAPQRRRSPQVTPELLASVLARYSRSNEGIASILAKVDVANPDASIDRILKFVDYGHASIGGLTGGLAVALDGVSMWLAYKLFEIAQMADGQESSTRYIAMDPANIPGAEELGIPDDLAPRWRDGRRPLVCGVQCRVRAPGRPLRRRARAGPHARGRQAGRGRPDAQELRAGPGAVFHPVRDEDQRRARPDLADVGAHGEAARLAPAPGGARRGRADPRRAAQAVAAAHEAQLRRDVVRGAGAPGAGGLA
jgi:hypothetical protein